MKAIVVEQAGPPEVLRLKEVPVPAVKPDWSLVKIKGFGINRSEIFTRQGLSPGVTFPRILGIECVGIVAETTDAARLPVGTKVISIMGEMGRAFDGSYAEYVLLPNTQIYPVQTELDWQTLATLPETFYTAYLALLSLKICGGERVLVRGASSGVGIAFAKLLKAGLPGIQLTGSSRQTDKTTALLSEGFDDVVQESAGILQSDRQFDRVLDLIGPSAIHDTLARTQEGGIVCSCGLLGGQWTLDNFDPITALQGSKYLTTAYSGSVSEASLQDLLDYVARYQIAVTPHQIFSLETVALAHQKMESAHSFGKNIVLLEEE